MNVSVCLFGDLASSRPETRVAVSRPSRVFVFSACRALAIRPARCPSVPRLLSQHFCAASLMPSSRCGLHVTPEETRSWVGSFSSATGENMLTSAGRLGPGREGC